METHAHHIEAVLLSDMVSPTREPLSFASEKRFAIEKPILE